MNHNPYTPPSATVADAAVPALMERPQNVTWAVQLMWLGFAIGIVGGLYGLFFDPVPAPLTRTMIVVIVAVLWVIMFGIVWWIFGALSSGRNWARILVAIVFGLNVLGASVFLKMLSAGSPSLFSGPAGLKVTIYLLQVAIYAVAVVLTLTPSASPWFKQPR